MIKLIAPIILAVTPAFSSDIQGFCKVYHTLAPAMQRLLIDTMPKTGGEYNLKLIVDGKKYVFRLDKDDLENLPARCNLNALFASSYGGIQD